MPHLASPIALPRLYAILDASTIDRGSLADFALQLVAGGATLIQYRNKPGPPQRLLSDARELRRLCPPHVRLIVNDRADIAAAAGCDGVHLGQDDISVTGARRICPPPQWIGVSAHNDEQVRLADATSADYIAIGPVFATRSKNLPGPEVGLEGVSAARVLTRKPLVAIGGITLENARSMIAAGADAVAVIAALADSPQKSTEAFLRLLM